MRSECFIKGRNCIPFAVAWVHPRFVCVVCVANRFSLSSYVFMCVFCYFCCCLVFILSLIRYFRMGGHENDLSHTHLSDGIHETLLETWFIYTSCVNVYENVAKAGSFSYQFVITVREFLRLNISCSHDIVDKSLNVAIRKSHSHPTLSEIRQI